MPGRGFTYNPAMKMVQFYYKIASRKGLNVTRKRRKPHAKFSHLIKHRVAIQQKRVPIYSYHKWHRKAYIKRK